MKLLDSFHKNLTQRAIEKPILIFPILVLFILEWYVLILILFKVLNMLVSTDLQLFKVFDVLWYHIFLPVLALGGFVLMIINFFKIVYVSFRKHLYITTNTALIANILQLFVALTMTFGVIFYFIDIFNYLPEGNFYNIQPPYLKGGSSDLADFIYQRYTAIPNLDLMGDYMFLSLSTISNLGFGEIYPTSGIAKLFCSIEVLLGILILAVSISAALSSKDEIEPNLGDISYHKAMLTLDTLFKKQNQVLGENIELNTIQIKEMNQLKNKISKLEELRDVQQKQLKEKDVHISSLENKTKALNVLIMEQSELISRYRADKPD